MSVFIGEHQPSEERRLITPVVIVIQTEAERITPPSGCQNTSDAVLAFLYQICHIISLIHQVTVILACARCKIFLCHTFSVHAAFIDSTCSCIQSRTCHFAIYSKVCAEHRQRKTTWVGNFQTFTLKSLSALCINSQDLCTWFS